MMMMTDGMDAVDVLLQRNNFIEAEKRKEEKGETTKNPNCFDQNGLLPLLFLFSLSSSSRFGGQKRMDCGGLFLWFLGGGGNVQEDRRSLNVEGENQKKKKNLLAIGPFRWSVEQISEYAEMVSCSQISEICLKLRIDGQSALEVSPKFLTWWFKKSGEIIDENELHTFFSALSSEVLPHSLVKPFMDVFPRIVLAEEEEGSDMSLSKVSDHEILSNWKNYGEEMKDLLLLSLPQLVKRFHEETSITDESFPMSLPRSWEAQPNSCRRYYGAHVDLLPLPQPLSSSSPVSDLFFYSFAISGIDRETYEKPPHPPSSHRVNPSSGGLHPEEVYILSSAGVGSGVRLSHYITKDHALETRFTSTERISLPEGIFVFGISAIPDREQWKYGIRGWRYTHLDLGHALGSICISSSLLSRLHGFSSPLQIIVFDALSLPSSSDAFGLDEPSPLPPSSSEALEYLSHFPNGREFLEIVVVVSCGPPISLEMTKEFMLKMGAEVRESWGERCGRANYLFKYNLTPPGLWAGSEVLNQCIRSTKPNMVGEKKGEEEEERGEEQREREGLLFSAKKCDLFCEWEQLPTLAKVIRERRSIPNFNQEPFMSLTQLIQILRTTIPSRSEGATPSSHVHMCLWIAGVLGIEVGRYFVWRGTSALSGEEICKLWFQEGVRLEKVVHDEVPSDLLLFRIWRDEIVKGDREGERGREEEEVKVVVKEEESDEKKQEEKEEEGGERDEEAEEELKKRREELQREKRREERKEQRKKEIEKLPEDKKMRVEASIQSCEQNIALNANVVFSFVTDLPLLSSPLSSPSSSSPTAYKHAYWHCGFLGQLIYISSSLIGGGCSGMGCSCDTLPLLTFRLKGLYPLYHMAVGMSGVEKYLTFDYSKRITLEKKEIEKK